MAESLGVAGTLEAAVAVLRTRLPVQSPVAAIVLGSGLGHGVFRAGTNCFARLRCSCSAQGFVR